ncbi:MAG TPA: tRNA (adenosine(37)-N6)-threonylcarbamoyltransferase complex ATPase subunit type 1 TsaE [Thermoanaerobaculia bacterium]|nr:tRNA (adenosine(37)-N6)-threonylcarbamoyltransferase complex ATPase subunit type 1 TsaE [Thermoanaerobaculia bacterium]
MTSHVSATEEETRRLGANLAKRLARGDVVLLEGDLGAGKTTFVKGIAAGLGLDPDDVSSPSFALVHEYGPAGMPPVLVHGDLYRVFPGASIADLGLDERESSVLAVEWPRPPLTQRRAWRVAMRIEPDGSRSIEVEPPGIPASSA